MAEVVRQQPDTAETAAAGREWFSHWVAGPTRDRWNELPVQRGDQAPRLDLIDARTGQPSAVSGLWVARPALLLFWRHFGCSCGRDRAVRIRSEFDDYIAAGATVALIGQGEPERTLVYAAANDLPRDLVLLCDPDERAYRAFGLLEGGPIEVLFDASDAYLTCDPDSGRSLAVERRSQERPMVDNPWLLPGEFVVAPDGRLITTIRFQFCEHWVDPRVNVAAIRYASGELQAVFGDRDRVG